ncbi:hypothetical protein BMS3Abin03_01113 [bacterium BMS3Abin03]|nr:hypothetical protein BMS3Abin03_01113 [bacterium BMS3Abin03]
MRKTFLIATIFLLIYSLPSLAQMTTDEYKTEKGNLINKKTELTREIANLKTEIDSLEKLAPQLEQNIIACNRDLFMIKYGKEMGQRIAYKRIWKGMTEEMLRDSWGKPDKIDKNVEKWGVFTQWFYGNVIFFFRDGKLTDWEGEQEK